MAKSSSREEGKPKRKSKSRPTGKARTARQKLKDRYAHAREDAQLAGLIPTTPEEALKPEAVPSSVQTAAPMPELIAEAIRKGWAVPEDRKPGLVDELLGIIQSVDMPAKVKVAAFNALRQADQAQYERDHPEEAAKAKSKGTTIHGNVIQNNMTTAGAIRDMVMRGELGYLEGVRASAFPSAPSGDRHVREVEACPSLEGDQQCAGEGVADPE